MSGVVVCCVFRSDPRSLEAIVSISILASSSSGNSALVSTSRTRILVDAGLSRKGTCERLKQLGVDPASLDAILVTHEHTDHVAGLPVLAKRHENVQIPVYISRLTAPAIEWGDSMPILEQFQAGSCFTVGDIDVTSFTIPHDAIDPVGFSFRAEGIKISVATDLGYLPDSVRVHLRDSDVLLLESNHDLDMLKVGPYPWSVKQRVMGRMGHLSNEAVSAFIRDHLDLRTSTLILGHLSEHNNHPALVEQAANEALDGRGRLFTRLMVAGPHGL